MSRFTTTYSTVSQWFTKRKTLLRWLGWFFAGNALLFWLIGLRYLTTILPLAITKPNLPNEFLAWLLLFTAYIGQLTLLAFLPCLVSLAFLLFTHKRWLTFLSAILCAAFATILLIIDTIVFTQYHFHLNAIVLGLLFNRDADQIFDFTWLEWLTIGLAFVALILLQTLYAMWLWKKLARTSKTRWGKRFSFSSFFCLIFSYYLFLLAGIYPWMGLNQQVFALPLYENFLSLILSSTGIINNGANSLENLGAGNFTQLKQVNKKLHYPLHPLICQTSAHPLNIVIIGIDSWRFDMVNSAVTPNIARFAQTSQQFVKHFSGGNGTRPGLFSLFYSLPATYWTAVTQQQKSPVLFTELLKQHYQLGIFASATLANPPYYKNIFSAVKNLALTTPGATPYARDKAITQKFHNFVQKAQRNQKPFFAFVFYNAPHSFCAPGNPVQPFQPATQVCDRLNLPKHSAQVPYFNRYKNALYYTDQLIAQDFQALQQAGLMDNTLVILTGDHSNEFNDNQLGYWGHASNFTRYQVQTPLIVHWPQRAAAVYDWQTSHYDIVPTLLTDVLGCQNPPRDYSIGKSLYNSEPRPYLLVASYLDFGIIEPGRITQFFPTGRYSVEDAHGKPLPGAKPHMESVKQAFKDINRYYDNE